MAAGESGVVARWWWWWWWLCGWERCGRVNEGVPDWMRTPPRRVAEDAHTHPSTHLPTLSPTCGRTLDARTHAHTHARMAASSSITTALAARSSQLARCAEGFARAATSGAPPGGKGAEGVTDGRPPCFCLSRDAKDNVCGCPSHAHAHAHAHAPGSEFVPAVRSS